MRCFSSLIFFLLFHYCYFVIWWGFCLVAVCAGVVLVFLCALGDVFEACWLLVGWCVLCVWTMELCVVGWMDACCLWWFGWYSVWWMVNVLVLCYVGGWAGDNGILCGCVCVLVMCLCADFEFMCCGYLVSLGMVCRWSSMCCVLFKYDVHLRCIQWSSVLHLMDICLFL